MKANSTGAKRNMAKLMLNSLFGRMGMSPVNFKTEVLTNEQLAKIEGKLEQFLTSSRIDDETSIVDIAITEFESQLV